MTVSSSRSFDATSTLAAPDLQQVFERMDQALGEQNVHLELILIGSAILITEGLPGRATCDIDVWRSGRAAEQKWLPLLAQATGLPIDPAPTQDVGPHLFWVGNEFIGYPPYAEWADDTVVFWQGKHLTLHKPPVSIILGSKIAASRDKDAQDIDWILATVPEADWRASLDKYAPRFDPTNRRNLEKNRYYFDLTVDARRSRLQSSPPDAPLSESRTKGWSR